MAFKDSWKDPRTGKDLLLQRVSEDVLVFRAVAANPPTADDFQSHAVLGQRPKPTPSYRTAQWYAVSMFDTTETVDRFIEGRARSGHTFHRARVRLRPKLGLDVIYNARTGHLDVFGFPDVLLGCVEGIG